MEIQRINTYEDNRFSQTVLHQHGCFLADGKPYEVEIISDYEAIIRGENQTVYTSVVEEFRFYTPHITRFYDRNGKIVKEYPQVQLLTLRFKFSRRSFSWIKIRLRLSAPSFTNRRILSFRFFQTRIDLFRWMGIPGYTMRL